MMSFIYTDAASISEQTEFISQLSPYLQEWYTHHVRCSTFIAEEVYKLNGCLLRSTLPRTMVFTELHSLTSNMQDTTHGN